MVKEKEVEEEIRDLLRDFPRAKEVFESVLKDKRWETLANMANTVAVGRWNYNDHGPVHSKVVTRNSIKIARIIRRKFPLSIEYERVGDFEDSLVVLILSSMFHDVGNCITRDEHEVFSMILSKDIIRDVLLKFYDIEKAIKLESYIFEGIVGHMGKYRPTSIEGKIVAVADGLDMEGGRARIPYKIGKPDIHKYSALAIKEVKILEGFEKPVKVEVYMEESAGVFQVEQVLMPKIKGARFEDYIEVYAIIGREVVRYL